MDARELAERRGVVELVLRGWRIRNRPYIPDDIASTPSKCRDLNGTR